MPEHASDRSALTGCPWHDVKAMLRQVGLRPTRQRMALGWILFGKGDPVMPGCLGLDALWQMVGFFLGWLGSPGKGRALGLGELKFSGQVLPTVKKVIYGIDIKRVMRSKLVLGIADGWLSADGNIIYRASDLKVGLFKQDEALQPSSA